MMILLDRTESWRCRHGAPGKRVSSCFSEIRKVQWSFERETTGKAFQQVTTMTLRPRLKKDTAQSQRGSGARTIMLLQKVAEMRGEFSLSQLAQRSSLPISSVHRILQPLLRNGLVARAQGSTYLLGPEYYRLATIVLNQIDREVTAMPFLHALWSKWQETAAFCLLRPAERIGVVTEIIQSPKPLRHVIEPFTSVSLLWGSLGRAILAQLKPGEIASIRARGSKGPISGSVGPELTDLLPELARARETGRTVYRNKDADLAGIAAPVFRSGSIVVGSIGVTMPLSRFERLDVRGLCEDVANSAARLSKTLGYRPHHHRA